MSTAHIRSWYHKKGVNFYDHPQSTARKGKTIVMTLQDHKEAASRGLEIMQARNNKTNSKNKSFVVGDVDFVDLKCFWMKIRCIYCSDVLTLCPSKKNLEANLQNHLQGTKHKKAIADGDMPMPIQTALSSRCKRRPSNSSSSLSPNQPDLH